MNSIYLNDTLTAFLNKLQCRPMPNLMAAQANIDGALCETSVIPLRVPRPYDQFLKLSVSLG